MKIKNEEVHKKFISKNLLNIKMVVNYFNFVFHNDVKTKSMHKILNFLFQFIKKHEIAFLVQGFSLLACSFNDMCQN